LTGNIVARRYAKALFALGQRKGETELALRRPRAAEDYKLVLESNLEEIDRLNILQATLEGMRRAVAQLARRPARVLIDGNRVPAGLDSDAEAIVKGDAKVAAISAASILAKVTRDRWMLELDIAHPGYGFATHKGYPTPEHLDALRRLGPCPAHRRSFAPVRAAQTPGLL